ncbi:MAG: ApaG domain [Rhodospirillales bacterium]
MDEEDIHARTTRAITVRVKPFYLDEQSSPEDHHFLWAYHLRIENNGEETVRLLSRYWRITGSLGHVQEVRGDGFEYASGTPLATPS